MITFLSDWRIIVVVLVVLALSGPISEHSKIARWVCGVAMVVLLACAY